jgi:uncharacterized membrane protein YphA (DoxX/SURF4 family)
MGKSLAQITALVVATIPSFASAHEAYVLDHATILRDIATTSPNPFTAYTGNEFDFFFWGAISAITVLAILFSSFFHSFEQKLTPLFFRLKRLAHPMVRLTCGVCLIASGLFASLFGPELPFSDIFGSGAMLMQTIFVGLGILVLLGLYTRYVAMVMLGFFAYAVSVDGSYLLTYANYFGEFLLLLILGSGRWSLDRSFALGHLPDGLRYAAHQMEHLAFPLMRVFFGFSVMYAAIFAKFIHSQLALDVVTRYHLSTYFPFDPLFVVLGALIIEFLAGLFLIIGFEIRWVCLFLIFWLTLSLLYFGEAVWPHLVLFGLGLALFFHGYDRYSLEGYFLKKHGAEPVL